MTNKSTGPRTADGKNKVSRNAVTHGLRATKWLEPQEQQSFDAMVSELEAEYQPETATEHLLIERLATAVTKMRRLQHVEDAWYAKERYLKASGHHISASLDRDRKVPAELIKGTAIPDIKLLDLLARYQTTLDRQISKTIGELMVLVDRRRAVPRIEAATPSTPTI